jgi:DinB superfamily
MMGNLSIKEIEEKLNSASAEFNNYCSGLTEEQFFYQPPGKWSAAQQVQHLITAANISRLAFTLPKFIVRLFTGKPNRNSRTYDELVAKYKLKLEQGGRASGRFIPNPVPASYGKEKLLRHFTKAMDRFVKSVLKNDKASLPDKYLAPHPLLGKITLRELGYFTIYHTHHHLNSIKAIIEIKAVG